MNKVTLEYQKAFDFAQEQQVNFNQPRITLSPSNHLLALYDQNGVFIFNTASKSMISHIDFKTISALFDIHDEGIYLTDSYSLQRFAINGSKGQTVINENKSFNSIKDLAYSPNYKTIIFMNHTSLSYYSPSSLYLPSIISSFLNQTSACPIYKYFIDPSSETLISSSFDCQICSYSMLEKNSLQFKMSNTISHCRVNEISFANGYAALTQDTITTKFPQIILLGIEKLNVIHSLNQSSSNFSLAMLNANNYIISYGIGDSFTWIYQNSLMNQPMQAIFSNAILASAFNTLANQAYFLMVNQSSSSILLNIFSLAFNCSAIVNTTNNTLGFSTTCSCKEGMLFDSSDHICKKMNCGNNLYSPCPCPFQQTFDSFSLECQLDCSTVYNSLLPISYGSPSKCSCKHPFQWSSQLNDCSLIDCSLIKHSENPSVGLSCTCQDKYSWNETSLSCSQNETKAITVGAESSSHVGLIIGIIFIVLVIILSAVIYYYKKYKKSPEDQPKTYQFKPKGIYEVHEPTPRPLNFENNMRTSVQLKQHSPHEQNSNNE